MDEEGNTYLSVRLPGRGVGQAGGGVSGAGGGGRGQGGGRDGGRDEAAARAVPPQGGRRDGGTVQSYADPALDLLGSQLRVLLLLLDQPRTRHRAEVQMLQMFV